MGDAYKPGAGLDEIDKMRAKDRAIKAAQEGKKTQQGKGQSVFGVLADLKKKKGNK